MKNNIMHNAIPEHSGACLATANGNAIIITTDIVSHSIIAFRLSIFYS